MLFSEERAGRGASHATQLANGGAPCRAKATTQTHGAGAEHHPHTLYRAVSEFGHSAKIRSQEYNDHVYNVFNVHSWHLTLEMEQKNGIFFPIEP